MTKLGRPAATPATASARAAWQTHRPPAGTGKLAQLAKALGIRQGNLNHWDQVPKKYLAAAAAFLGVAESDLRPDLFPASSPWNELLS